MFREKKAYRESNEELAIATDPGRKVSDTEKRQLVRLVVDGVASEHRSAHVQLGIRTGNWLMRDRAERLSTLPDRECLQGKRNSRAVELAGRSGPVRAS